MIYPIAGQRGLLQPNQLKTAIRPESPHFPRSRLVSLENTHNMGGGTIWPIDQLEAVCATARTT